MLKQKFNFISIIPINYFNRADAGHDITSLSTSRCPSPVSMTTIYVTCSTIGVYWWLLPKSSLAHIVIILGPVAIATAIMGNNEMWTMTRCPIISTDTRICFTQQLLYVGLQYPALAAVVIRVHIAGSFDSPGFASVAVVRDRRHRRVNNS